MVIRRALLPTLLLLCQCSGQEKPSAAGASGTGVGGNVNTAGTGGNVDTAGVGGNANSAGSAGAGGAKMRPPVGACDGLPASGMWEDVTPPGKSTKPAVNGTVGAAIIVDPFDARTVWLGTGGENDEI